MSLGASRRLERSAETLSSSRAKIPLLERVLHPPLGPESVHGPDDLERLVEGHHLALRPSLRNAFHGVPDLELEPVLVGLVDGLGLVEDSELDDVTDLGIEILIDQEQPSLAKGGHRQELMIGDVANPHLAALLGRGVTPALSHYLLLAEAMLPDLEVAFGTEEYADVGIGYHFFGDATRCSFEGYVGRSLAEALTQLTGEQEVGVFAGSDADAGKSGLGLSLVPVALLESVAANNFEPFLLGSFAALVVGVVLAVPPVTVWLWWTMNASSYR